MISASLVKELREKTGAGMMDCKKALEACNANIDEAIDWLREKGISKAAKKADRIAAEGVASILIKGNKAAIVEVNSETDFVAKNEEFTSMVSTILETIIESDVKSVTTYLKEIKFINSSEEPDESKTTVAYASGINDEIREAQIVFFADRIKDYSPKELYRTFAHEMDHILHYLAEKIDENDKPNSNNFHSFERQK